MIKGVVLEVPADAVLVRTTPEFDEASVPPGLLRAHRVAVGVWGRLVVRSGSLGFGFDHDSGEGDGACDGESEWTIGAGSSQAIPPERLHHVTIDGPVQFVVEFYEPPVR